MDKPEMDKLEIGSGSHPAPGHLHFDADPNAKCVEVVGNVLDGLPFDDNTFIEVRACHVLEHIIWTRGEEVLREICRVLKPGGKIDLALPNLAYVVEIWSDNVGKWKETSGPSQPLDAAKDKWEYMNHILYGTDAFMNNHKACYTFESLRKRLKRNGFKNIERGNRDSVQHLRVFATKK